MLVVYLLGVTDYFTLENVEIYRHELIAVVAKHWLVSPIFFIVVYALGASLSLPIGIVCSIVGGFVFRQPFCTFYVAIGATIGATVFFLSTKTVLAGFFLQKAGKRMLKIKKGVDEGGCFYLLFLRFSPIFPFWLVNVALAFFGVPLFSFIWTTFVGILPIAVVFTQAGAGIGAILDVGGDVTLATIFNTQVKLALIALTLFAFLPIIIRKICKKRG